MMAPDKKGFGGFGDLVSDISSDIATPQEDQRPSKSSLPLPEHGSELESTANSERIPQSKQSAPRPQEEQTQSGGGIAVWGWVAIVGLIILVIAIASESGRKNTNVLGSDAPSSKTVVPLSHYAQRIPDLDAGNARALEGLLSTAGTGDLRKVDLELTTIEKSRGTRPAIDKASAKESRAKNHLGLGAHKAGNLEAAAAQYFDAFKLNPSDPEIVENLGISLYALSDHIAARKAFYAALGLNPRRWSAWTGLAKVFAVAGETAKAENAFALAFQVTKLPKVTRQTLLAVFREDQNLAVRNAAGKALTSHYSLAVEDFLKPILGNLTGTGIPVYLPTKVAAFNSVGKAMPLYAQNNDTFAIKADADSYAIPIATEPECRGMYCLIGYIEARKILPSESIEGELVQLHGGISGAIVKGEDRFPDCLVFRVGDVRYSFSLRLSTSADIDAANSALKLGPLPVEAFSSFPKYAAGPASSSAPETPALPAPVRRLDYTSPAPNPTCNITYDVRLDTFGEGVMVELRQGRPGNSSNVKSSQSLGGNVHFGDLCAGSYFLAIGNGESVSVTPVREFETNKEYRSTIQRQRASGNVTSGRRGEL